MPRPAETPVAADARPARGPVLALLVAALLLTGCSLRSLAVRVAAATLGDTDVYASDDDPELVREAIPFGLKTIESLLATSPEDRGLLQAAARGFATYAYLLQDEADRLDASDRAAARSQRLRARNLYRRGRDHALRALEVGYPGMTAALRADPGSALGVVTRENVAILYWAGAAWAGAAGAGPTDLGLVAELPIAAALVGRVLALDEGYLDGAAHELLVTYEGIRPGGSAREARRHYERALELSRGRRASVHLALAESVSVREQDLDEFRRLVAAALAVDPDIARELRLANRLAHRRARWLLERIPDLFLEDGPEETRR